MPDAFDRTRLVLGAEALTKLKNARVASGWSSSSSSSSSGSSHRSYGGGGHHSFGGSRGGGSR